ncbi:MAG: hypothetical protein NT049_05290, partial [Planctomycetota bacterium]|nr:hypothetical protein [Planctomycetota bacterium]
MKYSLLLCVLTLFPPAATAATAQPASPHAMADLRQIVREAVAAKLTRVVIPPGVYRGEPEKGGKVHLSLRKVSDLEIVADGVTLVCTRPTRAIDFNDCTRVTLRGITVDYDHAGYPVEPYTRIDICDRRTRYRKTGKPFMWGGAAEVLPGGVVRLHNRDAAKFAQPGDLASMGGEIKDVVAHAIVVDDSSLVTLDHVTVFASNCMGIVAAGGDGDHRFLGCRIVPGPPPPGAAEARILSVNADAILTGPMR